MKKVVILNGAPGSGKDEGAKHIVSVLRGQGILARHCEFKERLFTLTRVIYGLTILEWERLYTRENKEKPSGRLQGLSPRQALIHISEDIVKPNFGKDYFGVAAAEDLTEGVNVFSDGGFVEEVRPIISKVGVRNVLIIRIHRAGHTFKGDSRKYLPDGFGPLVIDVENNGTLEEYFKTLKYEVGRWLGGKDE